METSKRCCAAVAAIATSSICCSKHSDWRLPRPNSSLCREPHKMHASSDSCGEPTNHARTSFLNDIMLKQRLLRLTLLLALAAAAPAQFVHTDHQQIVDASGKPLLIRARATST